MRKWFSDLLCCRLKMSKNPVLRFVGRLKTNKSRPNMKQKCKANEDPGIIPTVVIEEVSILELGSYLVLEDDKKQASTDITFASNPTFRYQHRGSLVSVINYYKVPEGTMRALPNIRVLGYGYLRICTPDVSKSEDNAQKWPRSSIWDVKKKIVEIHSCRTLLNQLTVDKMTWQPWESHIHVLGSEIGWWLQSSQTQGQYFPGLASITYSWEKGIGCKTIPHLLFPLANLKILGSTVTHFKQYVIHPVWEVETYGYVGDLHKHLIEELAEHVPIPPPQHLSFDKADTCLQESVDFTQ
ncbi:hypothetical protein MKW98_009954 [Papaver atlanticum]|uniref:Uncharacterized protein n=1 Tax=Papaver atlanticum TaxID=357466 RepID=A0AAD4T4L1_9MAGN|nr:hypothetical protein MKW98_009954 [Papaver atlanticum]